MKWSDIGLSHPRGGHGRFLRVQFSDRENLRLLSRPLLDLCSVASETLLHPAVAPRLCQLPRRNPQSERRRGPEIHRSRGGGRVLPACHFDRHGRDVRHGVHRLGHNNGDVARSQVAVPGAHQAAALVKAIRSALLSVESYSYVARSSLVIAVLKVKNGTTVARWPPAPVVWVSVLVPVPS